MVAILDLSQEYWQLARLVIALFQPLLVLVLIAGLVVATAHLLTMIGTRWGDRRASSKAMFFSVTIHLLLAMGLVSLIPEYRSNLFAKLAELDAEPIRIVNPSDSASKESDSGKGGRSPLFHRLPEPEELDRDRIQAPSQMAAQERALENPLEAKPFEPQPVADRERLPEPSPTVPQQEMPATPTDLQQAQSDPQQVQAPTQSRPEESTPSLSRERSMTNAVRADEPQAAPRPTLGRVDRQNMQYSPDRQAPALTDLVTPGAELTISRDDMISRREAPAPSEANAELAGQNVVMPTVPSASASPVDPQLARTESRTNLPALGTMGLERTPLRPSALPQETNSPATATRTERMSDTLSQPLERPQLSRTVDPFLRRGDQDRVPSVYRLRTDEEREKALMQFGGSPESEAAVDRSLKWMASVQNPSGYWDASDYGAGQVKIDNEGVDRRNAGREADVGVTALAVLAFLGKLNTVDQGEYSPQVNRALRWIVSQQTTKQWGEGWGSTPGYLGGNATDFEAMYCHAMATFALGEAYAMSRDNPEAQWLRQPLELAIHFILDVQNVDGGWRYIKGQREGDMSIFGWQVMALKSAEAAGIEIGDQRKARMKKFLTQRQLGNSGGLAGYRAKEAASAAMTAEALYCRQMLGIADDTRANQEAIQMMLANMPRRTELNFYYWYYGTLAMHQHGGAEWDNWNSHVRDLLISEQRLTGPQAGSWDPRDVWGGYGGRMYSTAIATLSLEVYYRYLPLYRVENR